MGSAVKGKANSAGAQPPSAISTTGKNPSSRPKSYTASTEATELNSTSVSNSKCSPSSGHSISGESLSATVDRGWAQISARWRHSPTASVAPMTAPKVVPI
jgi:hypothetical protein